MKANEERACIREKGRESEELFSRWLCSKEKFNKPAPPHNLANQNAPLGFQV